MFKNNKGITLIALVITIIILLILAGVSVSVLFGQEGLVEKAKWSAFASDLTKIEESIILSNKIGENGTTLPEEEVFDGLYDGTKISNTLKRDIVYAKEGKESEYTQEEINTKYESLKDDEGKIENLYYVSKKVSGKEKKYLYDKSSGTVFDAPGRTIFGKKYHIYKIGSITKTANGTNNINKPKGPVLPEPSDEIPDGWIPIYTIENWQKVATETQNYDIYNLSGAKVGTYNMNKNSNYRLMSDLDFTGVTVDPIKGFAGIFDGNGHYIRNITVDTSASTEKYSYYSEDNLKTSGINEIEVIAPAGLFDRIELGTVKNLGIQSATITGKGNVGILAGEIIETTIENCIVKDSTATSDTKKSYQGSIGGLVGWVYNKENPTIIKNIGMNNINITGYSVTSGMIGTTTADIVITGSLLENSTITKIPPSGEGHGGILGFTAGTNTTISDCYVGKTNFIMQTTSNAINACGGIIGATNNAWDDKTTPKTVNVSNCSIEDSELAYGEIAGGICGSLCNTNLTINISKCNVKNLKANAIRVGGILGNGGFECKQLSISECDVDNLETIEASNGGNYKNVGGILGFVKTEAENGFEIKDCNVTNSKLNMYTSGSNSTVAGIVGFIWNDNSSVLKKDIKNCNVENTIIKATVEGKTQTASTVHSAGILGDGVAKVQNCIVNNSHILMQSKNPYEGKYDSYGEISGAAGASGIIGVVGVGSGDSEIQNCKVKNTEIKSNYTTAAGICAYTNTGYITIKSSNVENCDIYARFNAAGVGGFTRYYTIDGVNIKDTNIISEVRNAAGITNVGWTDTAITNCIVQNCKIGNTKQEASKGISTYGTGARNCGNVGGIVGYCQSSKITNCNVIDSKISNSCMNTGGIAGEVISGPENITGCTVTNTNIIANDQNVGGIAGYFGNGSSSVKNNSVIGGSITAKGPFVGGIVGYDSNYNRNRRIYSKRYYYKCNRWISRRNIRSIFTKTYKM